jgi:flavodoxin
MKTAIVYYSYHHQNTLKVLRALAETEPIELINATTKQSVRLGDYDCIGFASGIYYGKFHPSLVNFARQYLPEHKPVFFICTYGKGQSTGAKALAAIAAERNCPLLGEFGCKGYDTFGPFKLIGGIAKDHPNGQDLQNAKSFYQEIKKAYENQNI